MPDASIPNVEQGQAITAGLENLIINGVNKAVLVSDLYRVDGFGVPFDPNVKNRGDLPAPFILETRIYANKVEKTEETTSWPPSERYMQQWIFLSTLADLKGYIVGDSVGAPIEVQTVYYGETDESTWTEVTNDMLATGWLCLLWDEDEPATCAESIYLSYIPVEDSESETPIYNVVITKDGAAEGSEKAFKIGGYKSIEVELPEEETTTVLKWFNCIGSIGGGAQSVPPTIDGYTGYLNIVTSVHWDSAYNKLVYSFYRTRFETGLLKSLGTLQTADIIEGAECEGGRQTLNYVNADGRATTANVPS